ncbi:MAG TPA: putative Ig domain-containing protein [Tepidisphaeraceae bacterium]|nr:putative Ig domain-containing protein [Tepidisphaeraceae bacterium]
MQGSLPQTRARRRSIIRRRARLEAAVYAEVSYPTIENLEPRKLLSGTTIYVDDTASGANNGTSWANAYTDLNTALADAQSMNPGPSSPVTIDVAEGVYEPGPSTTSSFNLVNDTSLVGGFLNGGSATPDPTTNHTFLYGQSFNAIIVEADGVTGASLSGFTVDYSTYTGVQVIGSVATIENCTINQNGLDNINTNGGGIDNLGGTTTLMNCQITADDALSGGGICNSGGALVAINCLIQGDSASDNGGGVYNYNNGLITLLNCTSTQNVAEDGQGSGLFTSNGSSATITNSILFNDSNGDEIDNSGSVVTVSYSDIGGGYAGTGNIEAAPNFSNGTPEFGLTIGSPCIDAGSNAALPANDTVDLNGNPRIINGVVDMGAYEFEQAPSFNTPGTAVFAVGDENSATVTTTAFPTATLMETPLLPAGLSFTDNGDGTATIAGIPTASPGVYQFTIIASNGITPNATQDFSLLIGIPAGISSSGTADFTLGQYGSFTVQGTGYPTPQISDITDQENGGLPNGLYYQENVQFGPYPSEGPYDLTPEGQNAMAVGDFNGDGRPDAAITDYSDGTIQILLNESPGSVSISSYTVGSEPDAIATGYLNFAPQGDFGRVHGDGHIGGGPGDSYDLVVADMGSNNIEILEGNGDGTFFKYADYTVTAPTAVAIADINGDNIPDIIVASSVTDQITVFLGEEGGGFSEPYTTTLTTPISSSPQAIATGYFGEDYQDVVVAGGDGMTVLYSEGNGFFRTPVTYAGAATAGYTFVANSVATGYFGGDYASIVLGGASANGPTSYRTTNVFYNIGDEFASPTLYATNNSPGPAVVAVGSVHDDDTEDIIVGGDDSVGFRILANNGDGYFRYLPISYSPGGGTTSDLAIDDFNGDGVPFILSTRNGYFSATPVTPSNSATIFGTPDGSPGPYSVELEAFNGVLDPYEQDLQINVNSTEMIVSSSNYTMTTGVSASFTVMSVGTPTGALSETGNLPAGVTFLDNGDGTASLFGTPAAGAGGVYDLLITADNGTVPVATQSFVLTVDQPPTITSAANTSFTTGVTGAFTITTSAYPTPNILEVGTLPVGVTFMNNGDGTASLFGTPASGTGGNYDITIVANNGLSPEGTQTFALSIDQPSAFTSSNSYTFSPDATGSFTITATGFPAPTISESGALPAGLTFLESGSGVAFIFGTPSDSAGGVYDITLTASNGIGNNATQMAVITSDESPMITSSNSYSISALGSGSFTISTTGIPTASITETGALPSGMSFVDEGNGAAMLFGTPAANTLGTYDLTITASNGVAPAATQTLVLSVVNVPSITSSNNYTFTTGTAGSFTVTTGGVPTPTLTETGVLPTGVSFIDNGDGTATLAGTPIAGTGGVYDVTITASNGVVPTATQSFTLTVDFAVTFTNSNNGTISVSGTNTNNTASITVSNGNVIITVDGDSESFPATSANNVNVVLGAGDDSVMVFSGAPPVSINGGGGNDTLTTQASDDTIDGGGGDNMLMAGNGADDDSLVGGNGNDTLMGGGSGTTLYGGGGDNILKPGDAGESVHGGTGNNILISASDGGDTLRGGSGSDFILGGGNSGDSIEGGLGLSFAQFDSGDSVTGIYQLIDPPPPTGANPSDATPAAAQDIASTKVKLVGSILKATTSSAGDTVVVSESGSNIIVTVDGTAVDTFPAASVGGIKLTGGGSGGNVLTVNSNVDISATLKGGAGNDSITGGGGSNVLMGGGGSDTLVGGAGTSLLIPDSRGVFSAAPTSGDSLVGGSGEAIADLAYYTDPMFLSNDGHDDSGDASAGALFTIAPSVQAIWGGSGSDTIVGTTAGMFLSGGTASHDSIGGTMASDLIAGGTGGKNTVIVGAEPVVLDLRNGIKDSFGGIADPSIDILTLDSNDVELG